MAGTERTMFQMGGDGRIARVGGIRLGSVDGNELDTGSATDFGPCIATPSRHRMRDRRRQRGKQHRHAGEPGGETSDCCVHDHAKLYQPAPHAISGPPGTCSKSGDASSQRQKTRNTLAFPTILLGLFNLFSPYSFAACCRLSVAMLTIEVNFFRELMFSTINFLDRVTLPDSTAV